MKYTRCSETLSQQDTTPKLRQNHFAIDTTSLPLNQCETTVFQSFVLRLIVQSVGMSVKKNCTYYNDISTAERTGNMSDHQDDWLAG